MLHLIIKKEIHDNFLNERFVSACVVILLLIVSSIVVLTENYKGVVADYHNRVATQDTFIDQFGHINRAGWMGKPLREPSHFQPVVLGIDREAEQENFVSNPVPALFSRLDFVTIVTIILSLMAILFSYNSVSGEREEGLLKQMLSSSISRKVILLGKFIGGNISLLIPFTIGGLTGLLYIALNPRVQLQSMDFGVFLILLLASHLYVAAFSGLGLLFSARSHTSNEALLKSLFAWVIVVLVIPNISPFLAAQIYRIPSAAKIERETLAITSTERDEIVNQRTREILQSKFADIASVTGMSQKEIQEKTESDPRFRERFAEYSKAWYELVGEVNREQGAKADKIISVFNQRSKYQEKLATIFASVSPFSNFLFIATDVTGTGIDGENHWQKQAALYLGMFTNYVEGQYQKEKQKNPALTVNDYLELRDRPRFQYQPQPFAEKLGPTLPQFGLLVFFNLIFFVGAFVSFLKYDAR